MAAYYSSQKPVWWAPIVSRTRRYTMLVKKWGWLVLLASSAGAFAGAYWCWQQPALFMSSARMMVGGRMSLAENVSYNEELANFAGTQIELMQSGEVYHRAEQRVLTKEPNAQPCRVQIGATLVPKTSIFLLHAAGEQPEFTQKMLNAVMDEYMAMKREMRSEKSENTASAINDQMKRVDREIRENEEALLDFQRKNNVSFMQEEANSASQYLVSLKTKLADMQNERQLLDLLDLDQNIDRTARDLTAGASLEDAKLSGSGPEVEYLRARQQLAVLESQRADFEKVLRPKHPTMVQLAEDIARQKTLIETLKKQSADRIKSRRKGIEMQIETTRASIAEWEKKSVALNEKLADYNRIKSALDRAKSTYDQLRTNLNGVSINGRIDQDMVTVLERASPALPRKPALEKGIALGGGLGFAAALAFLLLLNRFDDRMNSMHEFRARFEEKVLAQIPNEEGKSQLHPLAYNDSRHALAEAFRALRSSIFYMPFEGRAPKTLLITSAVPGEGKSTVAANLAITIAFAGSSVLLVDGDLRRGELHLRLGLQNPRGLSDILAGRAGIDAATQPTAVENLSFLPRGSNAGNPSELYLGARMEDFLRSVYPDYDYIVFDSSPVMVADDTTSLAPKIDAALFVVRFAHSSARRSREAIDMLKQRQANLLGIVCNAVVDLRQDYYGYAEYYSSAGKA